MVSFKKAIETRIWFKSTVKLQIFGRRKVLIGAYYCHKQVIKLINILKCVTFCLILRWKYLPLPAGRLAIA